MKIIITKKDILWNYAGTVFSMGINFMLLPFFLLYFDDDTLGIWYIYMNLTTVANLFSFGFSPSFARNIAYCWGGATELREKGKYENKNNDVDYVLLSKVIATCKKVYLIISIVAVAFLISIGTFYIRSVTKELWNNTIILSWVIFVTSIFLNLYFGYCNSILDGSGLLAEKNVSLITSNVVRIILTGIFLHFGMGLCGACIAYMMYGIIFRILCLVLFSKKIKGEIDILKDKHSFDDCMDVFNIVWTNSWRTGVISIAAYLCSYAGTILSSFYLPLAEVGVYSLAVQIVLAIERIANAYSSSQWPSLQVSYISGDEEKFKKETSLSVTVFTAVYFWGILFVSTIGLPLIKFIRPNINLSAILIISVGVSEFIIGFRNTHTSILSTRNNVDCWKGFLLSGCISVFMSFLLLRAGFGVWGILISTITVEVAFNFWYWAYVLYNELGISIFYLYNEGFSILLLELKRRITR